MSGRKKVSPDVTFDPQAPIAPDRALVPSVMKLNEQRVELGFWPKIRRVAARVPFARDALSVWYCAKDEETPIAAKGMMLAALAYFVLPVDAIPDFIAGLGYTDDAAVFAALLAVLGRNLKPKHKAAARRDIQRLRGED
ncbi:YkvA family protein [uncultured Phenylobacterium sp.]|uniref:YkvA family protein n=1 Tax=uncultured Phenylobacterium sp. TaxID=349273 RepID=UPI0025E40781|nr:YkvA family protein [uncultured Phenylobacterium sp.]